MDVALGVSVTGALARLALVESDAYGDAVLDESMLDLTRDPVETLVDTVTGTHRMLADEGHRLAATRLCWSDSELMAQVRQALEEAGVENVSEQPQARSAVALARNASGRTARRRGCPLRPVTRRWLRRRCRIPAPRREHPRCWLRRLRANSRNNSSRTR